MQTILRFLIHVLIIMLTLAGCAPNAIPAPALVNATSTPAPTQVRPLPTAMPGGQSIDYQNLRVSMLRADITGGYETEFGYRREPTSGLEFLWVNIQIENTSANQQALPALEHFSAIYATSEVIAVYGHRKDHPDYTSLKPVLYAAQPTGHMKVDAWLRFDVPAGTNLEDLRFVYLPDSLRVNFDFPTSGYNWADHPQFFWRCGQ